MRTLSSDSTLTSLSLSGIDFGTFDSETTEYSAAVENDVSETTVAASTSHFGASYVIRLGGEAVDSGVMTLDVGENIVTVEVTAEDGETTMTYTVTVTREELRLLIGELSSDDPPLNLHITSYSENEVSWRGAYRTTVASHATTWSATTTTAPISSLPNGVSLATPPVGKASQGPIPA